LLIFWLASAIWGFLEGFLICDRLIDINAADVRFDKVAAWAKEHKAVAVSAVSAVGCAAVAYFVFPLIFGALGNRNDNVPVNVNLASNTSASVSTAKQTEKSTKKLQPTISEPTPGIIVNSEDINNYDAKISALQDKRNIIASNTSVSVSTAKQTEKSTEKLQPTISEPTPGIMVNSEYINNYDAEMSALQDKRNIINNHINRRQIIEDSNTTIETARTVAENNERNIEQLVKDVEIIRRKEYTVRGHDYAGPKFGTLIWEGEVQGSDLISIEDGRSSSGRVSGDLLPGLPCLIQPSDTKKIAIASAPGPSNQYRKIVLRIKANGKVKVSLKWVLN
jgi:hypothetical protein